MKSNKIKFALTIDGSDTFQTSSILDIILTVSILAIGILLVTYLIHSI